MSVIVRFAPSPTGYLHIGGARTALFNYLFAKHNNGKFLLRIEDTDKDRSSIQAINAILQGLDWLELKHDGEYVLQSNNLNRHKEVVNKLLTKEKAYYCYTSSEELEEMRKNAEKKGEVFRFQSEWRNKSKSQSSTVKPVVRIKSANEGESIINDLVRGEVRVKNSEIDDLVLLRSDETPTYMLAVVVDDFDMNITHVIRGEDHLTNAFRQKIIYEACNWKVPEFAHIPLIHGADGAKMSKRHGATSVIEYKNMGYLPEAVRNYLLRLGWSYGDLEIISDSQAIELFNIENIGKSPSRFDFDKLNYLNKNYLKNKNSSELLSLVLDFLNKKFSDDETKKILKVINFTKEKFETVLQLANSCETYCDHYLQNISETDIKIVIDKKNLLKDIVEIIAKIELWNHDSIKDYFNKFAFENNLKIKDFGPALRIALTFSSASAVGIFDVVEILGKEQSLKRIENILNKI